jgi:type 1 glutamine amidotransferase/cytochrome c2
LRRARLLLFLVTTLPPAVLTHAQNQTAVAPPASPGTQVVHRKHILVISQTKGYEHDSISDGMAAIYNMGHESDLWDTTLRSDTELITKKDLPRNAKNLNYFDALVFVSTTGELDLDDSQKRDMMSFIKEDGKGFVGVHGALDTNHTWPEYGEMIGGWFDDHPWGTFNAPIVNEDPSFPAVRHFPKAFVKYDEFYQPKSWSRDKVNVLLSLDPAKLNWDNPRVHRTDHDFAVAWAKMYGNGRVFYSTLGHTEESWSDPDIRKMYFQAIRWVLGMTEGSTASHPRPAASAQIPASPTPLEDAESSKPVAKSYPLDLVHNGAALFQQNCAFCHGRDAAGGESGPDLTRSKLVSDDVDGEKIGVVVRNGRPAKGMPHFDLTDDQIAGLVAFIHTRQNDVAMRQGGRKGVDVSDLQTGNVEAGKQYFNGAGGCAACHSPNGDLAGIASRYQGLKLEQRMLSPDDAKSQVTVTLPTGQTVTGTLKYVDEFTVGLVDSNGEYRSWDTSRVKYKVDSPADAHVRLFGKYTDADIHNLMAYLQTLR